MKLRWIGFLVTAGAAGAALWIYPQVTAHAVAAEGGPVQPRIVARAAVVARGGIAEVRARIDGQVLAVHVQEGDVVEKGQLLAELEADTYGSEVARREAEQRAAEANARVVARGSRGDEIALAEAESAAAVEAWQLAEAQARRARQLQASGAGSSQEADDLARNAAIARARVNEAAARLRLVRKGSRSDERRAAAEMATAAKAAHETAQHQLDHSRLVSPVAGVVLSRRVDPGDTVVLAASVALPSLFEIADTSDTEIRVEIEEVNALEVAVGQAVELRTLEGVPVARGRVARIGAKCERRTIDGDHASVRADGLVRAVWVSWDGPPPPAALGLRLEAVITLPARTAATRVPRSAVTVEAGMAVVTTKRGWFVSKRHVEIAAVDDTWAELDGISPGELVVIP